MKDKSIIFSMFILAFVISIRSLADNSCYRNRIGETIYLRYQEIKDPLIIEYNANYYLFEDELYENPNWSLTKKKCFATLVNIDPSYIIFGMNANQGELLYNLLPLIEDNPRIALLTKTTKGNIYKYVENITHFLIFLIQIEFFNNLRYPDNQYDPEPKKIEGMIDSNMPLSEYILFACPLKEKPNEKWLPK